jgi:hypothetical protein
MEQVLQSLTHLWRETYSKASARGEAVKRVIQRNAKHDLVTLSSTVDAFKKGVQANKKP